MIEWLAIQIATYFDLQLHRTHLYSTIVGVAWLMSCIILALIIKVQWLVIEQAMICSAYISIHTWEIFCASCLND